MESLEDRIRRLFAIGSGYGDGDGSGSGDGYGYGDGSGSGDGDGKLKSYNHRKVYYVDGEPTLINNVRGMVAQGYIINGDKTLTPCYIVRHGNSLLTELL